MIVKDTLKEHHREGFRLELVTSETITYRHFKEHVYKYRTSTHFTNPQGRLDTVKNFPEFCDVWEYVEITP